MENKNCACLTRRVGTTNFKVKVYFSDDAGESFEDKMIRLISNRLITLEDLYQGKEADPEGAA